MARDRYGAAPSRLRTTSNESLEFGVYFPQRASLGVAERPTRCDGPLQQPDRMRFVAGVGRLDCLVDGSGQLVLWQLLPWLHQLACVTDCGVSVTQSEARRQ